MTGTVQAGKEAQDFVDLLCSTVAKVTIGDREETLVNLLTVGHLVADPTLTLIAAIDRAEEMVGLAVTGVMIELAKQTLDDSD